MNESRPRVLRSRRPRGRAVMRSGSWSAPWSLARAGRTKSRKVTMGRYRIAREPEDLACRRGVPNQVGPPGPGATRQKPLVARRGPISAGLTWSCGPTETPPERTTTSACVQRVRRCAFARRPLLAVAHHAERKDLGARQRRQRGQRDPSLELCSCPCFSGAPARRSSSPVARTMTRGRRARSAGRTRPAEIADAELLRRPGACPRGTSDRAAEQVLAWVTQGGCPGRGRRRRSP